MPADRLEAELLLAAPLQRIHGRERIAPAPRRARIVGAVVAVAARPAGVLG
jgi:hypothetical protein